MLLTSLFAARRKNKHDAGTGIAEIGFFKKQLVWLNECESMRRQYKQLRKQRKKLPSTYNTVRITFSTALNGGRNEFLSILSILMTVFSSFFRQLPNDLSFSKSFRIFFFTLRGQPFYHTFQEVIFLSSNNILLSPLIFRMTWR